MHPRSEADLTMDSEVHGVLAGIELENTQLCLRRIREFHSVVMKEFKKEVDYGAAPGLGKPVLLKPGAEKLLSMLGLSSIFEIIGNKYDIEKKNFFYTIKCTLLKDGYVITQGMTCCLTLDVKYFQQSVSSSVAADPSISANYCLKLAKKRSLVDACLTAAALSNIFTQDMESMEEVKEVNETDKSEAKRPGATEAVEDVTLESKYGIDMLETDVPKEDKSVTDDNGTKDRLALMLEFGRHRGKTLGYVYKNDHGYIKWLSINAVDEVIKSAAGSMLKDDELLG